MFVLNPVTNILNSPSIMTGNIADRPISANNGAIFISIDTAEIYSYDTNGVVWVLIGSGGGGGVTPNLQQVLTVGFIASIGILLQDAGFVSLSTVTGSQTGVSPININLSNSDGSGTTQIDYQAGVKNNTYALPDKNSVPDTFAMLSDLAALVGTLQQVTTLGNTSDQGIILNDSILQVLNTISGKYSKILAGFIDISNNDGSNFARINNAGTVNDNVYSLPDKASIPDIFAMVSDLTALSRDLQQVTDIGNTTSNPVIIQNPGTFKNVSIAPEGIYVSNDDGSHGAIIEYNGNGIDNNYHLPDKLNVPDIFAMLSDIPLRGQYTPTLTNTVNCSLFNSFPLQYKIMRDTVMVWGRIDLTNTTKNIISSFEMDIPYNPLATNFLNDYETAGVGASVGMNGDIIPAPYTTETMAIRAITGGNTVFIQYLATDNTNTDHLFNFSFTYIVPGTI